MYLYWDIEGKARLIEKRFDRIPHVPDARIDFANYSKLDEFILAADGLQHHVRDFSPADARLLFDKTQKTCKIFEKMDDIAADASYGGNPALKAKFKYALRSIYKLESLLHIAYTRVMPVQKTPSYIKEGLAPVLFQI